MSLPNASAHPSKLPCVIARFRSLQRADVAEHQRHTWGAVLQELAQEPASEWKSTNDPGWSPVRYQPERRAIENVREVYGLVLDYDRKAEWGRVQTHWQTHYGLMYTTKSHGEAGDRFRVVLPLSRPVTAAEYSQIWLWATQGQPADPQCKDASRFWYDPTIPPGGWRAEMLPGDAPIDVETALVLAAAMAPTQRMRAVTQAPVFFADQKARRAAAYLAKIPSAVAGANGHTQTFNAVAAVLIGFDLDPDTTRTLILEHYNPRCDPPWSEREIDHKIRSVAERCTRERGYLLQDRMPVHTTQQAAESAPAAEDKVSIDWGGQLKKKNNGEARRGFHNVHVFVRHHPEYAGKWSLNTMTGDVFFNAQQMPETFVHEVRAHADRNLGFSPGAEDVSAAIQMCAAERPFHPIQQYLSSVTWDGTPRLSQVAAVYLGAVSATECALVRKWMISAVARALVPGCKVDTSLMLYGGQGWGKSTFFAILGGAWHADSPIDISNKDSFAQIHAAWIYEFAELENVVHGRAESRLKAWLTSTHDMYRAPYAKTVTSSPRSCVICGTTNRREFLTDETGSRRFWIVAARGAIPTERLRAERDQLWAEARVAYESGEPWWLTGEQDADRAALNADYVDEDPWLHTVREWLAGALETTMPAVLTHALKLDAARQDRVAQTRVGRILTELGWTKVRHRTDGGRLAWKYVPTCADPVGTLNSHCVDQS